MQQIKMQSVEVPSAQDLQGNRLLQRRLTTKREVNCVIKLA